jgi:hypothetical protein
LHVNAHALKQGTPNARNQSRNITRIQKGCERASLAGIRCVANL